MANYQNGQLGLLALSHVMAATGQGQELVLHRNVVVNHVAVN